MRDVGIMLEARSNTPRPCVEQQLCVVSDLVCLAKPAEAFAQWYGIQCDGPPFFVMCCCRYTGRCW